MKSKQRLNTKLRKRAMLESMMKTLGNVSASTNAVGINRSTHYNWIKSDASYKERIIEINERSIDFVESALFKNIQKGKETSIIFYLKTKAKDRGYVETTHNINTTAKKNGLEDLSDEELLAIINRKV